LISGNRPAHEALERALTVHFGRPATLFSSGWHANLAVLTTLFNQGDSVGSDRLNHASLIDGLRLSRAQRSVLPHGSSDLRHGTVGHVTEGLFSMDGDRVDLRALRSACDAHGAWLVVDEAHAVGAVGPEGRGAAADAGVVPDVLVGTLGKAYGSYGAFVVGPPVLRDLLISRGRTFLFTTGLPEPVCRAALQGLALATDERRRQVARNAATFRAALARLGLTTLGTDHIVPVVLGERTMAVADALRAAGHYVAGIRPPTVAPGTERLRISVSAAHTTEHLESLAEALGAALNKA
jgi:8-amino-7-oxononanoate synthase